MRRKTLWAALLLFFVTFGLGAARTGAQAVFTTTTLAVTANGAAATTVASGSVVTLTAQVESGSTSLTRGQVNFCDATAKSCTDIHLLAMAQLTKAGTAVFKFRPGIGSHSYKAVFLGTKAYAGSASAVGALSVSGVYPTSTVTKSTGGPGSYSLAATVTGVGLYSSEPTGTVSFLDTSKNHAVLGTAALSPGLPALGFLTSADIALNEPNEPGGVVVADFNGDGIPDFADVNGYNSIEVFLGKGDGTFTQAATQPIGRNPIAPTVADFNEDGIPDIALVYYDGYTGESFVTVLIGKGDGTFTQTGKSLWAGNPLNGIAAGDFNGDGIPDLAITDFTEGAVTILLGKGDGTFSAVPSQNTTGYEPEGIAVGDFNGDGKLDLAVANSGSNYLSVFLGKGDGTFQPALASPKTGVYPESVLAADLNGDGILDLVVVSQPSAVLLGVGDGTFKAVKGLPTAGAFVLADFNGDGIPDLAAVGRPEADVVWLGKGDGSFSFSTNYSPSTPQSDPELIFVAAADFIGDGLSDLVVMGQAPGAVVSYNAQVFLSDPQTTATASASVTVGLGPHVVVASYTGDSNYSSSVSDTITLNGKPVPTALSLAVSAGPYKVGQTVKLTVKLSPSADGGYGTNGETVSFSNGGTLLGTGTLSSGVATISFTLPAAGRYYVTAAYAGDTIFVGSSSNQETIVVPAITTLALSVSKGPYTFAKPMMFTATLSPYTNAGFITNSESISLYSGSMLLGTSALQSGIATLTLNSLKTASYSIHAIYLGDGNFTASQSNPVYLSVSKATPGIVWPAPAPITYGTKLGPNELNATASVAGTFVYLPAAGTEPGAGQRKLKMVFTPTDATDYTSASAAVTLTVDQATPKIAWATPAAIIFGTALSATQLNASSPIAGKFTYAPALGAVLSGGLQTLTASFTPADNLDYTTAEASVTLTVNKATPKLAWAAPAAISYGTELSGTQLDAKASVAGTWAYTPAAGAVLHAGTQTLTGTFTPAAADDYLTETASVLLQVNRATPKVAWATPATITYGTPLGAAQLDATSAVAGSFSYTPGDGAVLGAGTHALAASFAPADTEDYTAAAATANLTVNKAIPTIDWVTPAAITYGTALSVSQLDATSPVAGSFSYSPSLGTVLAAGTQTLKATFTPADGNDYTASATTVTLQVNKAVPAITWGAPAAIAYGTVLSAAQLDATASVAGEFVYSPAEGALLAPGLQTLEGTFTPADAADYTIAEKTVRLAVTRNAPVVTVTPWATTVTEGSQGTVVVTVSTPPGGVAPTGIVSLYWNGNLVNTATLNGNGQEAQTVTAPSTAGTLPLYAVYPGDENFYGVKSAVVEVQVQK